MKTHLTEEQISQRIAGYANEELDGHIRECAECGAKLASFENAISTFRSSAGNWTDQMSSRRIAETQTLSQALPQARARSLRWALAAAIVAVIAAVPAYQEFFERPISPAVQESQSDEQLLKRVNAHLSQNAPVSLQPLTEMLPVRNDLGNEGEHQ